ncbi:MAG: DNA-processing protein DprA [Myxococcota bacterium]
MIDHFTYRLGDPSYPTALADCPDAPRILYGRGHVPPLPSVAIVGSRAATLDGRERADAMARALVGAGFAVVSGGAIGIDAAAHHGALAAAGATIAVLGTSLDDLYPPRNRALLETIATRGALLTPFPRGAPVRRGNFPRRNRIIAGLAQAVVVVEAGARSGSISTAAAARQYGRRLLAVPHSAGAHRLVAEGATAVDTPESLLRALAGGDTPEPIRPRAPQGAGPIERALLGALQAEPRTIDEVAHATRLPAGRVAAGLLRLELAGAALRRANGYVRLEGL